MVSMFFDSTIILYLFGTVAYFLCFLSQKKELWGKLGFISLCLSLLSGIGFVAQRWVQSGHPPFTSTFEVMFFLSTGIVMVYLIFEKIYNIKYAGAFVALLALIISAYATLFETKMHPILPALQNNFWLTIHVIFCFLGYAGFFISFVIAIIHLMGSEKDRKPALYISLLTFCSILITAALILFSQSKVIHLKFNIETALVIIVISLALPGILMIPINMILNKIKAWEKISATQEMETLIYKTITFGFPFLGIGIITGAVWANEAWGTYWSWDPKETWSLITWLIYFLYLHLRFVRGWRGTKLSWFSVIGFFAIIFTFFGVNYLLSGLHSYL